MHPSNSESMSITPRQAMGNASICAVRRAAAGAVLIGMSAVAFNAAADSSAVGLTLSATVRKHASLQVLAQPASVTLTAADIARGYLDVPQPAQLAVTSNTAQGFMLIFTNQGAFVRQVRVTGLGRDVQIGAGGGVATHAATGRGRNTVNLELGYRFELAAVAQQGVYAWPMLVSVQPL